MISETYDYEIAQIDYLIRHIKMNIKLYDGEVKELALKELSSLEQMRIDKLNEKQSKV